MDGLHPVDSPSGTATATKPSLRDMVTAAVRSTSPNSGSDEPSPAREEEAPAETSADAHDDEQGTTPSSDAKKEVPAAKAADERKPSPDGQKTETPAVEDTSTSSEAPKVWPAGEREAFAKLPDEAKRFILAREKAHNSRFTKFTQDNAAHRRFAEDVRGLFTPQDRDFMRQKGVDEMALLRKMADFSARLSKDPVSEVKALIGRLGLKPDQLGFQGGGEAQPNPSPAQPEGQQAPSQPDPTLLNRIGSIESVLQQAHREMQQQALGQFEQQVTAFEQEQDELGNAKYPHFEALFDPMMHLITTDPEIVAIKASQPRKAIEMAYEKASWLNPAIRDEMLASERAKAAQTQQQRQAATKAKTAASPRTSAGASGAGVVTAKPKNLREAVTAAVRSTNRN